MADTQVVSEMGEQWSPKIPPPRIAAMTNEGGKPSAWINGTPIGINIAKVPQEVPVLNEITAPATNSTGTTKINGKY